MGGISIVGTLCSLCLHALYVLCCKLNIPANNYTDNNLLLLLSKKFFLKYCVPRTFVDTLLTPLPNMVLRVIINCLLSSGVEGAKEAGSSHEVVLGTNLGPATQTSATSAARFSTLQRASAGDSAASRRSEKMKANPEKWHFSTLPRHDHQKQRVILYITDTIPSDTLTQLEILFRQYFSFSKKE